MPAISTSRLDEPLEMKGSGTPVSGASPRIAKRFRQACERTSEVIPAASSEA